MPHDNNLLIVSRHAVKVILFPSDGGSDITLLELTNQVALLKWLSSGLKVKNRFQEIIMEKAHVHEWGNASLRLSSLDTNLKLKFKLRGRRTQKFICDAFSTDPSHPLV